MITHRSFDSESVINKYNIGQICEVKVLVLWEIMSTKRTIGVGGEVGLEVVF